MKLILKIFGIFAALLAIAAIAVPMLVDVNQYKPEIEAAAESRTGRKLSIPGDIKLSLFPWIAIDLGQLSLGNAKGFSEPHMLEISEVAVSLKLLPLLRGNIEAGAVTLKGLRLQLQIDENGLGNWEDLAAADSQTDKPTDNAATTGPGIKSLAIGGLNISDARVTFSDDRSGASYRVSDFNLTTGPLQPGKPVDIDLNLYTEATDPRLTVNLGATTALTLDLDAGAAQLDNLQLKINELEANGNIDVASLGDSNQWRGQLDIREFNLKQLLDSLGPGAPETSDPAALTRVSGSATLAGDSNSASIDNLRFKLDDSTISGKLTIEDLASNRLRFDIALDRIDADRYLAPGDDTADDSAAKSDGEQAPEQNPNATAVDLSALRDLDIKGSARIGQLTLSGFELSDITTSATIANGRATLAPIGLALYGGKLGGSITADSSRGQRISIKQTLESLQFEPLTTAAMGERKLSGAGDLTLDLSTGGATVGELKKQLNGTLSMSVKDGSVYGFDLGRMLSVARAKLKGESGTAALRANNSPDAVQKTDFDSLTASAKITNGLLDNRDLLMISPDLRATGAGTAHLFTEKLDYDADITILETRRTEADQELQDMSGATVPFEIRGTFDEPKVRIALDEMAKQKAKAKVEEKKDELKEKAREKIFNKLFN